MLSKILILIFLTFLPFIELRLSIPAGILSGSISLPFGISIVGMGLNPFLVFTIAVITNILLGFFIFNFLYFFDNKLKSSKQGEKYIRFLKKRQQKIEFYVKKYGVIGLAIFIGIPLPGSGVYTGSLGAFMLGMDRRDFYKSMIIGVLIAAIIVTSLTLLGRNLF